MKKLWMSSVVLLMFSASMFLLQISCNEDSMASPVPESEVTVVYGSYDDDADEVNFFIANADGSDAQPLRFPVLSDDYQVLPNVRLSPDGKIYFTAIKGDRTGAAVFRLYRMDMDGTNPEMVAGGEHEIEYDIAAGV